MPPFQLLFLVIILAPLSLNFCSTVPSLDRRLVRPLAPSACRLGSSPARFLLCSQSCSELTLSSYLKPPAPTPLLGASMPQATGSGPEVIHSGRQPSSSLALSASGQRREIDKTSLSSGLGESSCCWGHFPVNPRAGPARGGGLRGRAGAWEVPGLILSMTD